MSSDVDTTPTRLNAPVRPQRPVRKAVSNDTNGNTEVLPEAVTEAPTASQPVQDEVYIPRKERRRMEQAGLTPEIKTPMPKTESIEPSKEEGLPPFKCKLPVGTEEKAAPENNDAMIDLTASLGFDYTSNTAKNKALRAKAREVVRRVGQIESTDSIPRHKVSLIVEEVLWGVVPE